MHFRNATIDDLPAIVDIYNSTIAGHLVTADTIPQSIQDKLPWFYKHDNLTRPLWIVEDHDNKNIGWVSFQDFYGRPAYAATAEVSIYLHPDARGKGYGKIILDHVLNTAPALKISTLLGFIFAHNIPSIQLFTKAGFEEWGHLMNVAKIEGKEYSVKIFGKKI